jgi:hypothetical protein
LGRGLEFEDTVIYIRDTALLAPAVKRSLEEVGKLYGPEYYKVDLPIEYKSNMRKLLLENKDLFIKYALQDSVITLKHANEMEKFNMTIDKLGIPLTLSSLGKQYVLKT